MLSNQTLNIFPGRHQRQNSTPTAIDTHRNFLHRRGLSLDYPVYSQHDCNLSQQGDHPTGVEYTLGQRLTPTASTREAQQQQPMARPGHQLETKYGIMQQTMREDALRAQQEEPRQERETIQFDSHFNLTPTSQPENSPQAMSRQELDSEAFFDNCYTPSSIEQEHNVQGPLQLGYESPQVKKQPCTPPSQTRMRQS